MRQAVHRQYAYQTGRAGARVLPPATSKGRLLRSQCHSSCSNRTIYDVWSPRKQKRNKKKVKNCAALFVVRAAVLSEDPE